MFAFATEKRQTSLSKPSAAEKFYTPVHGHPALRMRHFHITIDEKGREIWLMLYKKTLQDLAMPSEFIDSCL